MALPAVRAEGQAANFWEKQAEDGEILFGHGKIGYSVEIYIM